MQLFLIHFDNYLIPPMGKFLPFTSRNTPPQAINFSYSVVIRTLGNAGDKYEALLQSISRQTILPEEVIVVVPEDCRLEQHAINERIIHTPKGMVTQRAAGINTAKSDYILVCDDDIQFPPEMVENLYLFLLKHHLDCCLPMEGYNAADEETISLKRPLLTTLRYAFTGQNVSEQTRNRMARRPDLHRRT